MSSEVAIVLTIAHAGPESAALVRSIAEAGPAITVVAYAGADVAVARAACESPGIVLLEMPNAGYAAAANAGAAVAHGATLVFIDDAQPRGRWLEPLLEALVEARGGVAGPMVLTPSEECGFILSAAPLTVRGFDLQPICAVPTRTVVDAIARDCLATTRACFTNVGGFSDAFGDARASIDYCLRAGEAGRYVVVEPGVAFVRKARVEPDPAPGERAFVARWRSRAEPHENFWPERTGSIMRREFFQTGILHERVPIPRITVIVHGDLRPAPDFSTQLAAGRLVPDEIVWVALHEPPPGLHFGGDAIDVARLWTEVRGCDLVAFVRADTQLAPDWLNELLNVLERAPDTVAAAHCGDAGDAMPAAADGRCTLVAPRLIPQHLRIGRAESLDLALATWLSEAVDAGRNIAQVRRSATVPGPPIVAIGPALPVAHPAPDIFASIVMLSWNAPAYTEAAVDSIRACTRVPHEIIVIDNGSAPESLARVRAIAGITLIENAVNTGFAFGCNQGLAAARGTHVVLLNNDVIVTDGWLDALITVQLQNPTVGCSAPRTNRIASNQQLEDVPYRDLADLPAFAAQRAREHRGRWKREYKVVGFCMCLDRRMVAEIGGFDPRFGAGNFEDDDYCVRMRAAGYDIAVCDDAFIHHFGSVSFRLNNVDYEAAFQRNRVLFGNRWNVRFDGNAYNARVLSARGFRHDRDFVPLPAPTGVGVDWVAAQ